MIWEMFLSRAGEHKDLLDLYTLTVMAAVWLDIDGWETYFCWAAKPKIIPNRFLYLVCNGSGME